MVGYIRWGPEGNQNIEILIAAFYNAWVLLLP